MTYHLAVKGLRHKLVEVLRLPLGRGLLGVQARRAHGCDGQRRDLGHVQGQNLPERCDLGVKTAALAALGEMAALRDEGVAAPLVLACRGVKAGESTLKRFLAFSPWLNLEWSWM